MYHVIKGKHLTVIILSFFFLHNEIEEEEARNEKEKAEEKNRKARKIFNSEKFLWQFPSKNRSLRCEAPEQKHNIGNFASQD